MTGTFTDGTVLGASALNSSINSIVINAQTSTTYLLDLTDAGKLVTLTNASAITVTVPPNSSVSYAIGTVVLLLQGGTGQVTVAPGSGVTLSPFASALKIAGRGGFCVLIKTGTDTWSVAGQMTS